MKSLVPVVVAAAAILALAVFVSPDASRAGDDSAVGSSPDATITLSNFQAASVVIMPAPLEPPSQSAHA